MSCVSVKMSAPKEEEEIQVVKEEMKEESRAMYKRQKELLVVELKKWQTLKKSVARKGLGSSIDKCQRQINYSLADAVTTLQMMNQRLSRELGSVRRDAIIKVDGDGETTSV